jgi:S1-C subfamily serine protease
MKVPQSQAEITLGFVPVVRQTAPAVVSIYTRKVVERRASPFAGDPFFEQLFGDMFSGGRTRRRIENSLGSGGGDHRFCRHRGLQLPCGRRCRRDHRGSD